LRAVVVRCGKQCGAIEGTKGACAGRDNRGAERVEENLYSHVGRSIKPAAGPVPNNNNKSSSKSRKQKNKGVGAGIKIEKRLEVLFLFVFPFLFCLFCFFLVYFAHIFLPFVFFFVVFLSLSPCVG